MTLGFLGTTALFFTFLRAFADGYCVGACTEPRPVSASVWASLAGIVVGTLIGASHRWWRIGAIILALTVVWSGLAAFVLARQ